MGHKIQACYDQDASIKAINGYPNLGNLEPGQLNDIPCVIAIGNNITRQQIALKQSRTYLTAIHASAIVDQHVTINEGTVIMQGAIVQRDSKIGKHCIINTNASVDHDNLIGDFVHVSPGATLCGNVQIGEGTHIGAGATILPNIRIGAWCKIGAGAVVTNDIADNSTAIGIPAKVIQINEH